MLTGMISSVSGIVNTSGTNLSIGDSSLSSADGGEGYNIVLGEEAMTNVNNDTADHNIAIGYQALEGGTSTGENNIAIGQASMDHGSNAADNVISIGKQACRGAMTSGADGTVAIGLGALNALTSGAGNIGIGYQTLLENVSGNNNIAIGYGAMDDTADLANNDNIAIGINALGGTWVSGASIRNIAIGSNSMLGAMNGASGNTCVCRASGTAIISGDDNVCIGRDAGELITTGNQNTAIGAGTDCAVGVHNQIAIGYGVVTNADSQVRIGNASHYLTYDASSGGAVSITSDKRVKKDIQDSLLGLNFINLLRPVTYVHKNSYDYPECFKIPKDGERPEEPTKIQDGLIAQEVKEVMDNLNINFSGWDEDPDTRQSLQYSMFIVPLIKAVQELSQQIEELKTKTGEA